MKKKVKLLIGMIVVISVIALCIIYTRPLTLGERYPYIDFSQCSEIRGYHFTAPSAAETQFIIQSTDADFDRLSDMIQSAELKTKLSNLLPQGTKIHPYSKGDYKWEIIFRFDNMSFPDGSTGSGDILHINNFFGDLEFFFNGETVQCRLDEQEQWARSIMEIVSQHTVH